MANTNYVYYTHPSGKVEEMTREAANALEKKQGGSIAGTPGAIETPDFDAMTVAELKDYATANGVSVASGASKADLLAAITAAQK